MRHLGSIVLSLLLGPIVYVLTGVGLVRLAGTERDWYQVDRPPVLIGLGALAAAGILYAVLVFARLSPLGPFLVGLGFLGLTTWGLFDGASLTDLLPESIVGVSGSTGEPAYAVALLLAVPLLATIVIPRRWRRFPDRPADTATTEQEGAAPAYPSSPPPYTYPGAPIYTPPTDDSGSGRADLPAAGVRPGRRAGPHAGRRTRTDARPAG